MCKKGKRPNYGLEGLPMKIHPSPGEGAATQQSSRFPADENRCGSKDQKESLQGQSPEPGVLRDPLESPCLGSA